MWMQNSHSDVQQSSYMCINNEKNHITFQSIKRFSEVVSEFSRFGNSVAIRSLIFLCAPVNRQLPTINEAEFPKVSGWNELKPVRFLEVTMTTRDGIWKPQVLTLLFSHPLKRAAGESAVPAAFPFLTLLTQHHFFKLLKKKKKI